MRRIAQLAVSAICLLLFTISAGAGPTAQGTMSIAEQYLFTAANSERVQRGIRPLRWDEKLFRAAEEHAREMAARANIAHQYPGEADLAARGRFAGARFTTIAENVAQAPSAITIHTAWMNSEGHRANLLDPRVDSVGISVLSRDGELYAVEDFDKSVDVVSFDEQENAIGNLVRQTRTVEVLPSTAEARRTCEMETGYAGHRQPWFVMRFTAGELDRLPQVLREQLASGRYGEAVVGACQASETESFTAFRVAVMLFR